MDCSTLYVIIKMTTNEAIAIAISDTDCMPYRYREASLELANAVLNLRQELIVELRSELAIAAAYCANKTVEHCVARLKELEG